LQCVRDHTTDNIVVTEIVMTKSVTWQNLSP